MKPIICDFDDFQDLYEENTLKKLDKLKQILPKMKVNLFTIPRKTSNEVLKEANSRDWIQLIPHSFKHNDNYECAKMTYKKMRRRLSELDIKYYIRGFKPAGWQISKEAMRALKDLDFWLAVQWSDGRFDGRSDGPYQPAVIDGLKFYALSEQPNYNIIHGHCQNVCGNGLDQLWSRLIAVNPKCSFLFINDIIKK